LNTIKVDFVIEEDSPIGAWVLMPKDCPAAAHLAALGQKPWSCVQGLQTSAQGMVPLGRCKHFGGDDTLGERDGHLSVKCTFGEDATDAESKTGKEKP